MTNELKDLKYPGVYPDENKIIPYSPRKNFGFVSGTTDKFISLESMTNMSIDQLIELYKNGYRIEDTSSIVTAQGVYVSTGALFLIGIGILAYIYFKKNSILHKE